MDSAEDPSVWKLTSCAISAHHFQDKQKIECLLVKSCFLSHYASQGALCSQWNCRLGNGILESEARYRWLSHVLLIITQTTAPRCRGTPASTQV